MRSNKVRNQTAGTGLSLVGRREIPKELDDKVHWRFAQADLDQFAADLEIAREVYQAHPDLVTAPKMPAHLEALTNLAQRGDYGALAEDDMADLREKITADPVLATIVSESREEVMGSTVMREALTEQARKLMRRGRVA